MYSLINRHAAAIVRAIPLDFVTEYEWLLMNQSQVNSPDYQRRYRAYWAMNAAQLGADFYIGYFDLLSTIGNPRQSLSDVCCRLYDCSGRRDGRKSLQFSFATKLLHMANPQLPIYDSRVANFYFFERPENGDLPQRISTLLAFHEFLTREYKRVLEQGLLQTAIDEFRDKLKRQRFTDEKVIDSLIWKTEELLSKGALMNGRISYV